MSSGWAPTASARAGTGSGPRTRAPVTGRPPAARSSPPGSWRSSGTSTSQPSTWSSTTWTGRPEALGLGAVAGERAGAVGEPEARAGRARRSRWCRRSSGRARAARRRCRPRGRARWRAGGRRGRRPPGRRPRRPTASTPASTAPSSPRPGRPVDGGADVGGPGRTSSSSHTTVTGSGAGGPHDPGGHLAGQDGPGVGRERRRQAQLGRVERLHRDRRRRPARAPRYRCGASTPVRSVAPVRHGHRWRPPSLRPHGHPGLRHRGRLVGNHGRRPRRPQHADDAVGPAGHAGRADRPGARERRLPRRLPAARRSCGPPPTWRRPCARPTCW